MENLQKDLQVVQGLEVFLDLYQGVYQGLFHEVGHDHCHEVYLDQGQFHEVYQDLVQGQFHEVDQGLVQGREVVQHREVEIIYLIFFDYWYFVYFSPFQGT